MRVVRANSSPERPRGDYVLYWMIGARRTSWSFALDHAVARANALGRPLVVLEALRCGYPWASDRMHAFVLEGMADNARACAAAGVTYVSYVEPQAGAGSGLLAALAARACLVVTDDQPGFFLPRVVSAAAARLAVALDTVDGNGLLPLREHGGAFATAMAFRRVFQRVSPPHLVALPSPRPLAKLRHRDASVRGAVLRRYPSCDDLARLPIDHTVRPVAYRGGSRAARAQLARFVATTLPRYGDDRHAHSLLSPYLHFGHISAHEVAARVWSTDDWDPSRLASRAHGRREGWWGLPRSCEAFLDELVTWRELGYGFCFHRRDHARYSALPAWARATLAAHACDPRPERYTLGELEAARTADPVWNAAQRELVTDGRIGSYLRMLWGKKILEWSPSPRAALTRMIELNNKYAVDGRDPNSYSGILWTLGLFDRPWGPERPIFGLVRYMSSAQTARKLKLSAA
jgi:deoxyribodipyrimidine photo-lyase